MKLQKIGTYQPGPTTPLPEAPPPFVPPRMSNLSVIAPEVPKVWRVQMAELHDLLGWLIPCLQEKHPRLTTDGVASWLANATQNRLQHFIRTANVVGLFDAETSLFDTLHQTVVEKFVRSREHSNDEACLLYVHARDWAVSIRAGTFAYNRDSDCSMTHVGQALSDVKKNFTVRKSSVFAVSLTE